VNAAPIPVPRAWRIARGHRRLFTAVAVGVASFGVLHVAAIGANILTRAVIGWDIGIVMYLAATAILMARSDTADITRHGAEQDEGALSLMILTVAAAMASLGAVFAGIAYGNGATLPAALTIVTVVMSWMFIQTIFAFHYAYEYYDDADCAGGLKFPDDGEPDYWDFLYFAFVLGMTFQVSDVAITNKHIRRVAGVHGVVAFFFTTAVVALTVNLAASAIQH
jgi:uncharacterized membrane protein